MPGSENKMVGFGLLSSTLVNKAKKSEEIKKNLEEQLKKKINEFEEKVKQVSGSWIDKDKGTGNKSRQDELKNELEKTAADMFPLVFNEKKPNDPKSLAAYIGFGFSLRIKINKIIQDALSDYRKVVGKSEISDNVDLFKSSVNENKDEMQSLFTSKSLAQNTEKTKQKKTQQITNIQEQLQKIANTGTLKEWVKRLQKLETNPGNKLIQKDISGLRKQLESLYVLKKMRTGITIKDKERRIELLRNNSLLKRDDSVSNLFFKEVEKRQLKEKMFFPRKVLVALGAKIKGGALEILPIATSVKKFGYNRLQMSMAHENNSMVLTGNFKVGIDKLRNQKFFGKSKKFFARQLNKEMDHFVTEAINEFGKGSQANPFNLDHSGNDNYPELSLAALIKIKEKAVLNDEDYDVLINGERITFKSTSDLSESEKNAFNNFEDTTANTIFQHELQKEALNDNTASICQSVLQARINKKAGKDLLKNDSSSTMKI